MNIFTIYIYRYREYIYDVLIIKFKFGDKVNRKRQNFMNEVKYIMTKTIEAPLVTLGTDLDFIRKI